ncbi:hypothetical protein [Nocardioides bruguierae]|uniref:Glycosyltransferase RgtA/B/C/D-like domain-containing protein n=1 Tax=Nocardioides bruguierae TaxID=2945102 RepID=A0A9X2D7Q5_9ACTN|nr:hypothetical protein [Nocardioides bruguierae]MCL8024596.1 hypothetical protein [Nocardioides bruguierae]MCM0620787.1 hypothetical protein [Nocardioides bruguierae]
MSATVQPAIVTNAARLAGIVQAVGRRSLDVPRRRWESVLVLAVTTIVYSWFGFRVVAQQHVVSYEVLDRLNRALMIWHNNPAKLSAIGFDYPPLQTLLVSPLAIYRFGVDFLAVIPVASAFFAGLLMMFLNTMMRRTGVPAMLRIGGLAALGLNPLFALYASTGGPLMMWLAFLLASVGAVYAWYITADVRFVMIGGLGFAVAGLAGYTTLMYFLLAAIGIGAILAHLGADGDEVEGTMVGFAAPAIYVVALWTGFNLLLLKNPIHWITSAAPTSDAIEQFTVLGLLRWTGELVLYGAPLAIVVLPALFFVGLSKNNPFAVLLGLMLTLSVLTPAMTVLLGLTDSPMAMENAVPILVMSVIGALWLARSAGEGVTAISGLVVLALVASIPWTFQGMRTYKYQALEMVFTDAVLTGESQEGATTRGGQTVALDPSLEMGQFIQDLDVPEGAVLTDNAATYAVMLFSGEPELFLDRIDQSDGPWLEAARDPAASDVDWLLVTTDGDDLLTEQYSEVGFEGLTLYHENDEYRLYSVPEGFTGLTTVGS